MNAAAPAPIVGSSQAIKTAVSLVERFAPTTLPILLVGATGTGKELFAQHIHFRSGRRGPLIDVNCGALPQEIAESLLLGHRRGAFTGAIENTAGHLERAHTGTLFLDEILHLSLSGQVKLLRALETGEVQALGTGYKRRVDFRVIATAQEDTAERLQNGAFRRDLFQRLAGIVINLPALSDRPEDIMPLARHFAEGRGQRIDADAVRFLRSHSWPGNVRELKLAIDRASYLVSNGTLPGSAIREAIALGALVNAHPNAAAGSFREGEALQRARTVSGSSHDDLLACCSSNGWDASRIARSLGVARSTLYDRLRAAGISLRVCRRSPSPEFRSSCP